jgi:hypothetical protein
MEKQILPSLPDDITLGNVMEYCQIDIDDGETDIALFAR